MDSNLVKRILFAAVAIPLALGVVWWGGWPLAALVALVAGLGSCELFTLAERQGVRPLRYTGMGMAIVTPLLFYAILAVPAVAEILSGTAIYLLVAVTLSILMLTLWRRAPTEHPLSAAAITLLAVFYTAMLPAFLLIIRSAWPTRSWAGTWVVFFPLVVTWVGDSAAMFGGRAFGRVKLAPNVSPGKTRAGAIAGVVGGACVAPIFSVFVFPAVGISVAILPSLLMALTLSVVGQVGDLVKSLFKREAGVKDSSSLIPGHGGVLDRFDSLYFALPVAAFCYHLILSA